MHGFIRDVITEPCPNLNSALTDWPLINSFEAEWRRYASVNEPSLVKIMACRLVGAKPLFEPMLDYCKFGN